LGELFLQLRDAFPEAFDLLIVVARPAVFRMVGRCPSSRESATVRVVLITSMHYVEVLMAL
jgi:hypothetical protein